MIPSPPAPAPAPTASTSTTNNLPSILPLPTQSLISATLPPPGTFDFLPQIHALLSRLLLDPADKNALQAKDLANEVAVIRRGIALAKAAVVAMPGIGRTVDEQQDEIRRVGERVDRLRGLIQALGGECDGQIR